MKTYKFESNDISGYSNIVSRITEIAEYDLELDREAGTLPIDPADTEDDTCGEAAMDAWAEVNGYVKVETINFDNTNADATFYMTTAQFAQAVEDPDFTPRDVSLKHR